MDIVGGSSAASPCSSYHPSPCAHTIQAPDSSSFPSPSSSPYTNIQLCSKPCSPEDGLASSGLQMWTPAHSGTCSPTVAPGTDHNADIPSSKVVSDEFAFGSNML
ncbi:unnamed protein product [Sphenostylis stenocarpa]|uniref:Protein BZR1 homolog n=1 Tax=Sphenostylis stenocarpa TaxID=92480 RepID=A0AA86VYX6_9FABA|nr:unnamed protein product [Sphenostylis stenocarpa]